MKFIAGFVVIVCIHYVIGQSSLPNETVVPEDQHGRLRDYEAELFPKNNPKSVLLKGINVKTGKNDAVVDAVSFVLDTVNTASLEFGYFHGAAIVNSVNSTDLAASAFGFRFRSFYVFEYVEGNSVPGFQNGTADNITGLYDLSMPSLSWKDLQANHTDLTVNGTDFKIWTIVAETTDEVFLVRFTAVGTNTKIGTVHLSPDSVKVDIRIRWFTSLHVKAAWTTGPSNATTYPNAMVGLVTATGAGATTVEASSVGNGVLNNSNPTVSYGSQNVSGFFSYETSADTTISSVEAGREVHANVTSSTNPEITASFAAGWLVREGWFSFNGSRPTQVYWDPEFGASINYTAMDAMNNVMMTSGMAGTSGMMMSGMMMGTSGMMMGTSGMMGTTGVMGTSGAMGTTSTIDKASSSNTLLPSAIIAIIALFMFN